MPLDIDGLSHEELVQLNHRVVERLKMLWATQAHVDMMTFNLGAGVSFDSQHGRQFGIVVKYNRKTVTVAGRRRSSVARIARIIVTGERRRCRCRPRQKTEQEKTTAMPQQGSIAAWIEWLPGAGCRPPGCAFEP